MNIHKNLKYTNDHEWVSVENGNAIIGITDFAQKELGDIVFVEVETEEETLEKGEAFGTIEAVKTVSDLFMPISGEVLEFNSELEDNPDIINKDPYNKGWIIKVAIENKNEIDELLSYEEYSKLIN